MGWTHVQVVVSCGMGACAGDGLVWFGSYAGVLQVQSALLVHALFILHHSRRMSTFVRVGPVRHNAEIKCALIDPTG